MSFNVALYRDQGLECQGQVLGPFKFENPTRLGTVWVRPRVTFGRNSYMNDGYIREDVEVGRFCSIGRRVSLAAGEHPVDWITTHPIVWESRRSPNAFDRYSLNYRSNRKTSIEHDVFIGDNVVVLPGVRIGTGAVLGANAVVNRDVPPYAIVGGVPGRVLRYRFSEDIISRLLESEWWMLPDEAIKELPVNDISQCLDNLPELRSRFGTVPIAYLGDDF